MRSIPEKTLEHWCSIHLTYRYRAKLRMWWPTAGEDIDVSGGPLAPGKRIWLELKTTEWVKSAKRHDLKIDLDQLAAYGRASVPDFYVFPTPPWEGELGKSPKPKWAGRLDPSDFAYESYSFNKWFPHWLYVVPGSVLRRIVASMPAKNRKRTKTAAVGTKRTKNELRIAEVTAGTLTWIIPAPNPGEVLPWRDFWTKMQNCGDGGSFAAQFVLPSGTPGLSTPPSGTPTASPPSNPAAPSPSDPTPPSASADAAGSGPDNTAWADLKEAAKNLKKERADGEPESYEPDELRLWTPVDGTFIDSAPNDGPLGSDFIWGEDTARSMVLLSVDALL